MNKLETAEGLRLAEAAARERNWQRWGPYLSERQWGTIREDYSPDGSNWTSFPYEHSLRRAYRWGEDGLLGITDRECRLCFAVALWNGNDPHLKERLFGLTNPEGNHAEDVKEVYFYLDATPTHSYLKALYKYPQREFPYQHLRDENKRRGRQQPEYELTDAGAFDGDRYWDVQAEYAKASPDDILIRLTVSNRGPAPAILHLLVNGDKNHPNPPEIREHRINQDWPHLFARDILSVPDKWEHPAFFAWDTAFHAVPLARIDPAFAKRQLEVLLREWYLHTVSAAGRTFTVKYVPGELDTAEFGGNSNWRDPIWMPLNFLLIEALRKYHTFYGDDFTIECPTGSGKRMTLDGVARELGRRLGTLFLPLDGRPRPCHGIFERFRNDPHWRDYVLFHEYFDGDTGRGLGATHQTGWTALIAVMIEMYADHRHDGGT